MQTVQYWTEQRTIYANTEIANGSWWFCSTKIFPHPPGIWTDAATRNKGMKEIEDKIEREQKQGTGDSWQSVYTGTLKYLNTIGGMLEEKRRAKVRNPDTAVYCG